MLEFNHTKKRGRGGGLKPSSNNELHYSFLLSEASRSKTNEMYFSFWLMEVGGEQCGLNTQTFFPWHSQDVSNVLCVSNPTTPKKTHIQEVSGTT